MKHIDFISPALSATANIGKGYKQLIHVEDDMVRRQNEFTFVWKLMNMCVALDNELLSYAWQEAREAIQASSHARNLRFRVRQVDMSLAWTLDYGYKHTAMKKDFMQRYCAAARQDLQLDLLRLDTAISNYVGRFFRGDDYELICKIENARAWADIATFCFDALHKSVTHDLNRDFRGSFLGYRATKAQRCLNELAAQVYDVQLANGCDNQSVITGLDVISQRTTDYDRVQQWVEAAWTDADDSLAADIEQQIVQQDYVKSSCNS